MKRNPNSDSLLPALAFLAGAMLGSAWSNRSGNEFEGKLVLVTGGSRGLGNALVREFAGRGARVFFCARHEEQVRRAEDHLRSENFDVRGVVVDVTRPEEIERLAQELSQRHGTIDVLVNNAGAIQVAPFALTRDETFQYCLDLFVHAPLRLSRAFLPDMVKNGSGQIVNIASVGGQVIAPHMAPYNCAKAALVALSECMSVELDRFGIQVLTVVPGLMRTGSHRNAQFAGESKQEYAWFSRLAVHPLTAADPKKVAADVVRALLSGRRTLYSGWEARLGPRFHNLFPETTLAITSVLEKLLPGGGDNELRSGESMAALKGTGLGPLLGAMEKKALSEHQAARYQA